MGAQTGPVILDVPGSGLVGQRRQGHRRGPAVGLLPLRLHLPADGAVITSDSTLRFRGREEVESSLAAQDYQILDVRETPDRPGHEFVFITERTT